MESVESPLDVLSRAATMVQRCNPEVYGSDDPGDSKTPEVEDTFGFATKKRRSKECNSRFRHLYVKDATSRSRAFTDAEPPDGAVDSDVGPSRLRVSVEKPLDMSMKTKGNARDGRVPRPSVITPVGGRGEYIPGSVSMCDPVIDEHFRRSLGADYAALFDKTEETPPAKAELDGDRSEAAENEDSASLNVDDHFAKALGDAWKQIRRTLQSDGS